MIFSELFNALPHGAHLMWVESDGGFIENDNRRFVDQRIGQAHTLAIALGKFANHLSRGIGEVELFNHLVHAIAAGLAAQPF